MDVLEKALKEFKLAEDAENPWRKEVLEDLNFALLSDQWPKNVINSRELNARPCLTINKTLQFVRQVTNDARMNRPQVKVVPVDDSDVEVAEVYEGLIRNIQVRSNADVAYDTASLHQVAGGVGYIRIITDYVDDESFDQEALIKEVKNPFSIYLDPSSVEADGSDAKFAFVVKDYTREEFEHLHPDTKTAGQFKADGVSVPGWLSDKDVRVAEYFCVEETPLKLVLLVDGSILPADQAKDLPIAVQAERTVMQRKVMWRKITCMEVLEKREWPGKFIPIVPMYGEDVRIGEKRSVFGLVRNMKDSQRQYNYWTTAQTEAIALAPRAPWLLANGQQEGYEEMWSRANSDNQAYLIYNPVDINGTALPAPQRITAEPPIQAMAHAVAQASDDMKASTGIYDASLGNRSNETSGKAIMARQKVGDIANFNYIDNQSRAIRHVGVILVDLIPKIYDAPRIIRIIGEDESEKMVPVNQELEENGVMKVFDLTTGKYDVMVEVGPSFNTKRQESADALLQLTQSIPAIGTAAPDLVVKVLDFPMADELAERLKKTLPPELQDKEDGEVEIPPQIQAQLAQSQQMIDQLTQALNAAHDELDMKKAELESKERIAAQNNETKVVVEAMKQNHEASLALMTAQIQDIQAQLAMAQNTDTVDNSVSVPEDNMNTMAPSAGSESM